MATDELTVAEAARVFADLDAYTDERRFHAACARLRREAPITLVEADGFPPFYALTRHADVMEAERNPEVFKNLPQPVLMETERERVVRQAGDLATLVHMDDPDHRMYRALFAELIPRLRSIEPAGPAELSRSIFVGGHKRLPIRFEID